MARAPRRLVCDHRQLREKILSDELRLQVTQTSRVCEVEDDRAKPAPLPSTLLRAKLFHCVMSHLCTAAIMQAGCEHRDARVDADVLQQAPALLELLADHVDHLRVQAALHEMVPHVERLLGRAPHHQLAAHLVESSLQVKKMQNKSDHTNVCTRRKPTMCGMQRLCHAAAVIRSAPPASTTRRPP